LRFKSHNRRTVVKHSRYGLWVFPKAIETIVSFRLLLIAIYLQTQKQGDKQLRVWNIRTNVHSRIGLALQKELTLTRLFVPVQCEEQIDPACCGVAVGSSSPGCAAASKGAGVHGLKGLSCL